MCRTRVCLQWISETAGVIRGPIFPEKMQATKQQALWAKDKESKSRSGGVWRCGSCGCRLRLESEPTNIAESDADTDTDIGPIGSTMAAYVDNFTLYILHDNICH